jgi:hypothetical protein
MIEYLIKILKKIIKFFDAIIERVTRSVIGPRTDGSAVPPRNSRTAKSGRAAGQLRHRACGGFLAQNSPRALNLKEKWRRSCRK